MRADVPRSHRPSLLWCSTHAKTTRSCRSSTVLGSRASPIASSDVPNASLTPFRSRGFRLIWAGALVSNIGTWMETVALGYYVADTTGKASWSAVVAAAGFLPGAVARPGRLGDGRSPAPAPGADRGQRAVGG